MDSSIVKRALQLLGERLLTRHDADVEVLVVGASAGMLTGQLPRGRTTVDCDVMVIAPRETEGALLAAAICIASSAVLKQASGLKQVPGLWLAT